LVSATTNRSSVSAPLRAFQPGAHSFVDTFQHAQLHGVEQGVLAFKSIVN
jgi:hypothetical protein